MTIQYTDGKALEAVLLSRTETKIRAMVEGGDDVMEFSNIRGAWVSEDCEPVRIVFAWQRKKAVKKVSAADCICSQDLAARLIHLLLSGEANSQTATAVRPGVPADLQPVRALA
jgi:hypothetical protein